MSMLLPSMSGPQSAGESAKESGGKIVTSSQQRSECAEQLRSAMSSYVCGHLSSKLLLSRIDNAIRSRDSASIVQGVSVLRSLLYVCEESRRLVLDEALSKRTAGDEGLANPAQLGRSSEEAVTNMSVSKGGKEGPARDVGLAAVESLDSPALLVRIMSLLREDLRDGNTREFTKSILSLLQLLAGAAEVDELVLFMPLVYNAGAEPVLVSMMSTESSELNEATLALLALLVRNRAVLEAVGKDLQGFLDPVALCLGSERCSRSEHEAALSMLSAVLSRFKDGVEVLFGSYEEAGGSLWVPLGSVVVREVEALRNGAHMYLCL